MSAALVPERMKLLVRYVGKLILFPAKITPADAETAAPPVTFDHYRVCHAITDKPSEGDLDAPL